MVTKINFPTNLPISSVVKKSTGQKLANQGVAPEASAETQVNISSAAADKLRLEQTSTSAPQSKLSDIAHRDPDEAAKLAFDFAHFVDQPLLDISGGLDKIKYSQTGILVTPENSASFQQQTNEVAAKKLTLYNEEKDKGTPDAVIFDKLLDLLSNQSEEFKGDIGLGLRGLE